MNLPFHVASPALKWEWRRQEKSHQNPFHLAVFRILAIISGYTNEQEMGGYHVQRRVFLHQLRVKLDLAEVGGFAHDRRSVAPTSRTNQRKAKGKRKISHEAKLAKMQHSTRRNSSVSRGSSPMTSTS